MALPQRPLLYVVAFSAFLILVSFSLLSSSALANQLSGDPGDAFVFPGESPVAPDGTSQQGGPSISSNTVFWTEYDSGARMTRVFFKDLSLGEDEPGHALIEEQTSARTPAVSLSGNRVVWSEMVGAELHLYYKDQGVGGFESCSGTSDECAAPLAPGYYWQEYPAISPDGSKVAYEYGRSHDSQIHIYDFNTGVEEVLYGMPGGDQQFPSVDDEWVVWEDNRDFNSFIFPLDQHIYAKRIGTADPPISIADNGHSAHASVGPAKVTRNHDNEPVVFYLSSIEDRYGHEIYTAHLYNLSSGTDQTIDEISGQPQNPSIDGDKIVWRDCTENVYCDVVFHDLSTGITQVVSQDPDLGARNPEVSASSGYVVWLTSHLSPTTVYYNRMGDTAQALAERYAPILSMHKDELFEPKPVELMLEMPGTYLRKFGDENFSPIANPTPDDLVQNLGTDFHIDMGGNTMDTNNTLLCNIDRAAFYSGYLVPPYNQRDNYPRVAYAHVVGNAEGTGNTVIQYWLFYYVNNHDHSFHEGDWELIEVTLNDNLDPVWAAYSQHNGGTWRQWSDIEGTDMGPHPVAYVAKGSHANYFKSGNKWLGIWDDVDNEGSLKPLHDIRVMPEPEYSDATSYEWLRFMGNWGERTDESSYCLAGEFYNGPNGPSAQTDRWSTPLTWAQNLSCDLCSVERDAQGTCRISMQSPADIDLYDSLGNHTGINDQGVVEEQIPNSEYMEVESTHEKIIVIYGAQSPSGYQLEINGTGEGVFNMLITTPDHQAGTLTMADYIDVPVSTLTQGSVALDDLTLALDDNGDGQIDAQRPPDAIEVEQVDFTPPAKVNDLAADSVSSDSVTLGFTAPGDDGDSGTAQEYDLRYSTEPINEDNWKDSIPAPSLTEPQSAGSPESVTINGLEAGATYYFALVTLDEIGLSSKISNVAFATTTIPHLTWSMRGVYWAGWDDYVNRLLSIDYRMSNDGTATAYNSTVQASLCVPDTVYTVTELPLAVGDLVTGGYADMTLKYYIPPNVGSFTSQSYATCSDDAGREYWFPGPIS